MNSVAINAFVFLFCFSLGYLLTGRRPILALSTRFVLVVLAGLSLAFAMDRTRWHELLGAATLAANAAFVAFATIDYVKWVAERLDVR